MQYKGLPSAFLLLFCCSPVKAQLSASPVVTILEQRSCTVTSAIFTFDPLASSNTSVSNGALATNTGSGDSGGLIGSGATSSSQVYNGTPTTVSGGCVTASATPLTCPASNGTTYTPPGLCVGGDESYTIMCGMNYAGGLVTILGVNTDEGCIAQCVIDPTCVAVAFDFQLDVCYEKSSVAFGNATVSPNIIFAYNQQYSSRNGNSNNSTQPNNGPSGPSNCVVATEEPAISCPASNGTYYTPPGLCVGGDDTFMVLCNTNYNGAQIYTSDLDTDEKCIAKCSSETYCVAAAFNTETNTCSELAFFDFGSGHLDTGAVFAYNINYAASQNVSTTCVPAVAPRNAIACPASNGLIYTPPGRCIGKNSYKIDCGVNYDGDLYAAIVVNTDEKCIDACSEDPSCLAVAFEPTSGTCYIKTSITPGSGIINPRIVFAYNINNEADLQSDGGCVKAASSPPISCPASNGTVYTPSGDCLGANSYKLTCGMNYAGDLITLVGVDTDEACIAQCNSDPTCIAVAFDPSSRACFEKSSVALGTGTVNPNIIFAYNINSANSKSAVSSSTVPNPGSTSSSSGASQTASSNTLGTFTGSTLSQATSSTIGYTSSSYPISTTSASPTAGLSGSGASVSQTGVVTGVTNMPAARTAFYIVGGTPVETVLGGSTTVYTLGSSTVTTTVGGITTTYTSGGSTSIQVLTGSDAAIPTNIPVNEAVISECPWYDGRLHIENDNSEWAITCGVIYNGTVMAPPSRRSLQRRAIADASDCTEMCNTMSDCLAISYTELSCIYFSEVDGWQPAPNPAVSALRVMNGTESDLPVNNTSSSLSATSDLSDLTSTELSSSLTASVPESSSTFVDTASNTDGQSATTTSNSNTDSVSPTDGLSSQSQSLSQSDQSSTTSSLVIASSSDSQAPTSTPEDQPSSTQTDTTGQVSSMSQTDTSSSQISQTSSELSSSVSSVTQNGQSSVETSSTQSDSTSQSLSSTSQTTESSQSSSASSSGLGVQTTSSIVSSIPFSSAALSSASQSSTLSSTDSSQSSIGSSSSQASSVQPSLTSSQTAQTSTASSSTLSSLAQTTQSSSSATTQASQQTTGLSSSSAAQSTTAVSSSQSSLTASSSSSSSSSNQASTSLQSSLVTASSSLPSSPIQSSSVTSSSITSTTTGPSSTSNCAGSAEAAVCTGAGSPPDGQVRKGSDGEYFVLNCYSVAAGSNTFLTSLPASTFNAIGECIAACVAYNANPANTNPCQYGQVTGTSCELWGNVILFDLSPAGRNTFYSTNNATLISEACAYPALSSSSSTSTLSGSLASGASSSSSVPSSMFSTSSPSSVLGMFPPTTTTSSTSSPGMVVGIPRPSTTTSSTSSSASATETAVGFSCPAADGTIAVENGVAWRIGCSSIVNGPAFGSQAITSSWNDCFLLCDAKTNCTGFVFAGLPNGVGAGTCYYRNGTTQGFLSNDTSHIGAVLVANYQQISTTTTSSTTTSASPTPSSSGLVCPAANGTIVTELDGQRFQIYCNYTLYLQGSMGNGVAANTLQQCIDSCDNQADGQCYGSTFVGNPPFCEFFTAGATLIPVTSGYITALSIGGPPQPSCPGSNNTIYADVYGVQFKILCNINLIDPNTPAATTKDSLVACINDCDRNKNANCSGVTWIGDGPMLSNQCYYRGYGAAQSGADQTIWSAVRISPLNSTILGASSSALSSSSTRTVTSSTSSTTATASPLPCTGWGEDAQCNSADTQIRQGHDGLYYGINCGYNTYSPVTLLQSGLITNNFTDIGACIRFCIAYNAQGPINTCQYGQIDLLNAQSSCTLYSGISSLGHRANQGSLNDFYLTTNPSEIAAACSNGFVSSSSSTSRSTTSSSASSMSSSSRSSTASSSLITSSSSTLTSSTRTSTSSGCVATSAQPTPTCPASNNTVYTECDGSQWMILCNVDYTVQDSNVIGVGDPLNTTSYKACIDLCMNQGTNCTGVTYGLFGGAQKLCNLKKKMWPTLVYPGYEVDSAVRMSPPGGPGGNIQNIINGGFDNGTLDPWYSISASGTTDQNGDVFQVINGKANITFPFGLQVENNDALGLQQVINTVPGSIYYSSFVISQKTPVNSDVSCFIWATTSGDDLFDPDLNGPVNAITSAQTIYLSGILESFGSYIQFEFTCSGSYNVSYALDNVTFATYNPAYGSNEIYPAPTQILQNSAFSSGQMTPWTFQAPNNYNGNGAFAAITNQQAVISFTPTGLGGSQITYFQQDIPILQQHQTYTLTANVNITIPNTGVTCELSAVLDGAVWDVVRISTSHQYSVNVQSAVTYDVSTFLFYTSCSVTTQPFTISYDNVYLTVNT